MTGENYVTRIAPSPTGDMHLGTARTAYFNYLAARASGGKFILRIDDTDTDRNRESCVEVIKATTAWLGLEHDIMFMQSEGHRQAAYKEIIDDLKEAKLVKELDNGAIALKWDNRMSREWIDTIAGPIPITDTNIEQIHERLILARGGDKLGQPTYQFCSVVDDWDYDVNYIIRGVDHITNTAKQVALWWAINQVQDQGRAIICIPIPKFAHVGLIFKDKKKMSKRDNAASMLHYRDKGYSPDALLNFMLRMGWGPKEDNKENSIINRERALKLFLDGGSMRNVNCGFDGPKLEWYSKVYSRSR